MITCRSLISLLSKRRTAPIILHRFYSSTGSTNDPFELLGITRSASKKDIKRAFIRKAKQFHPDLNKSSEADRKFIELRMAYETVLQSAHIHESYYSYSSSTSTSEATSRPKGPSAPSHERSHPQQSSFADEYYDVSKPHPEASRYTTRGPYTVPETRGEGWRERNAAYYSKHWEMYQEDILSERDMETVIDEMFKRMPLEKPDIAKLYRERFEVITYGRRITPEGSYYPMVFEAEQYNPGNRENPKPGLLLDVFMHSRALSSVAYLIHNQLSYYKGSELLYHGIISDYKMEIKDIDGNLINIVYLIGKGQKKYFSIRDAADSTTLVHMKETSGLGYRDITYWTPQNDFIGSAGRTFVPAIHVFNPYHDLAEYRWAFFLKDIYLHKPVDPAVYIMQVAYSLVERNKPLANPYEEEKDRQQRSLKTKFKKFFGVTDNE